MSRKIWQLLVILSQLCLLAIAADVVEPRVFSISPHYGSYEGATRLYIRGQGFSSSASQNSEEGQEHLGNKAYLISDSETVPCDVENDASHETMIVCYTRPMKNGKYYYIQVEVDGNKVPFNKNCYNKPRSGSCSFQPRYWRTPFLRRCHVEQEGVNFPMQTSFAPGSLITCSGRIFTQIYGNNNQLNENDRTVSIRRVYSGGQSCELLKNPDVLYGLRLTSGDEGTFTCKPKGTFVGLHNVSLILADDYGRSDISKDAKRISGNDKVYSFQTYAEVTGISPQSGSGNGGTRVTIQGRYFDNTTSGSIEVFIGGVSCAVVPGSLTGTQVECIAGEPPEKRDFYPGSRGVYVETWSDEDAQNLDALKLNSDSPNYEGGTVIDSSAWKWNNDKDNFVGRFTGVFVVPTTDLYKFKVEADDRASIFLNCSGNKTDLTKVAYTDRPVWNYKTHHFQSSDWMVLEKGQECFFISTFLEYTGGAKMTNGALRATTAFTASQSNDAKNEVQVVDFQATFEDEKQAINFNEWSSQEGVVEEQDITVQHWCIDMGSCDQVGYRLKYDGVKTLFIAADASASTVRNALRQIFALADEDVDVTRESSSGVMRYIVRFKEKRGDYFLLDYEKYPAEVMGLSISIEEKTKGVPERKNYRLQIGGRLTSPIVEDADVKTIQEALSATRNAHCPDFLLPDKRKSTVLTTFDYETTKFGEEWGTRRQDVEPFCGTTSIKNSDYIYYAGRTADNKDKNHKNFHAHVYSYICLAHRGLMYDNLHLTGTFKGDGRSDITGTHSFANPLATHETEWRYSCINLMDIIRSRDAFSHVDQATLSAIRFIRKGTDYDYYLDAITIASEQVTDDVSGVLGIRTLPALADGHPVKEISIEQVGSERAYEIVVKTYECGKIPLISMPYIATSSVTEDESVQQETLWSAGTNFTTTRLVSGVKPMTGNFDLTVNFHDGRTKVVPHIPVNITGNKFAERLESEVPGFGQAKISRGGGCHARDYIVEWLTNGGDKPQMEVRMENVKGASDIRVSVRTWEDGGVLHFPFTGDMLRLAYDTPQVEVLVNGYPSKCVGSCDFETSEDLTPIITNISPTSGSLQTGISITISGSNLDAIGEVDTTVKVGKTDCVITFSSSTSISCDLSSGTLGTFDVSANIGGKGFARKQSNDVSLAFTISGGVAEIDPSSGFKTGGTKVIITGYGFSENTVFEFPNGPCEIVSLASTEVTCITPASSAGASSATVTVNDGSVTLGSLSFTYQEPDAEVSDVSPQTSLLTGGQRLTISGTNINQDGVSVHIGAHECEILQASTGSIVCSLPSAPRGDYKVLVTIPEKGYAGGSASVTYKLEVNGVFPNVASIHGGVKVTIDGEGFADEENTEVKFGSAACEIDSISATQILCTLEPLTTVYTVTAVGTGQNNQRPSFSWEPMNLEIEVGDTVIWKWDIEGAPGGWDYGARVFTIESSDSDVYDGATFESSPDKSSKGIHSYTFNNMGTYYISSGRIDHPDWGSIVMKGSIIVGASRTGRNKLSLTVAGHEANYHAGGSYRKKRSTCAGAVSLVPECAPLSDEDSSEFSITSDTCYTPKITSISHSNGTADTTVTIRGTGFGEENCANAVIIGDGYADRYESNVISSTSTEITFKPTPVETTRTNTAFYVKVCVDHIGKSISEIQLDTDRRFSLMPSVESISPLSGSLSGGTLVTISGFGFPTSTSSLSVFIGNSQCDIQSATYFEINCLTPPSASEITAEIEIAISGQKVGCTGACQFAYSVSSTPTITSVSPITISSPDTEITLVGTGMASDVNEVEVYVGDELCDVKSSDSTSITCNVAMLPAGSHSIHVRISGIGKARFDGASSTSVESLATIADVTPDRGSNAGGTVIVFTGNGFNAEDVDVKIGENSCQINKLSLTNFRLECVTPAKTGDSSDVVISVTANEKSYLSRNFEYSNDLTPVITSISPIQGQAGETVEISGVFFDPDDMTVTIGDSVCSNISGNATSIICTLGNHAGGQFPVSANVGDMGLAESNVYFNYTLEITSVALEAGSHGGGNVLTIIGNGFSSRSEVKICDILCKHGDGISDSEVTRTQIKCRLSDSGDDATSDTLCDVTVSIEGQSVSAKDVYTFAADKTPTIASVSPERGGTQGGTYVTITGTLFSDDSSKVSVTIGGIACDVISSSDTEIQCTTNSRGQSLKAEIEVMIDGKGLALNEEGLKFYYVDVWSSRWTWGGNDVPVKGDFIVVPTGQTLLIDTDIPVLKMLLIQGGIVIFDEKDIHLQCEIILITDGGVFQVGTEEKPFQHNAVITLHGHLRSPELPIYGTKAIGVRNGTLDLHGRHVPITWTLLAETASAGSNVLNLKHAVTWQAGDKIVIASTGHRHSQNETETAVILSVSGTTVTLEQPLRFTHISKTQFFEEFTLQTHAEVALLTRNVVVQGAKHVDWAKEVIPSCEEGFNTGEFATQTCFQGRFGEEEGSDQFGGQIMIHHRSPGLDIARARIEHVELRHVGQAFRLGRYPIHFHLLGDVSFNNYVRGCAIHHSFNRAITIHNTHHLLIERNVVYDIMGGAVFIEDGIEHGNKIQYNLVLFCKQSTSLQNDDITPAAFWVTNPNNTLQHNAAAGGTHFGFWYRIHEHPDGPSADNKICQQLHPVEKFENNTVHSHGWFGLWVFQKYIPRGDGSCESSWPTIAEYHSLTAWNCEKGAELVNVGAIKFFDFVMAHNEKAGIETKLVVDEKVQWGQVGTYNSHIIAHATALTEGQSTRIGMILPFSEGYEVKNTTFINFDQDATVAIGVTSIDGTCTVLCGGWETRFFQISYQNSPNKGSFRWEHEAILRDLDGTLSGSGKHSVIMPYNPTVSTIACPEIEEFSLGEKKGVLCDGSVKSHRVSWNNALPTSLEAKYVSFTTGEGSSFIPFAKKRLTHKFGWMGTMLDGGVYKWVFENAEQLTNISYQASFYNFEEDDCIIVTHNLTQKPDRIFVVDGREDQEDEDAAMDDMVTCEDNVHGDYYFDAGFKTLSYVVSGRNRGSPKRGTFSADTATPRAVHRHIRFKVYRCFYNKCLAPPDPNSEPPARRRPIDYQIWHNSSYWKMNGDGEYVGTPQGNELISIPPIDQNVRIEKGSWMVVNQDLPRMRKLWIEGTLELEGDDEDLHVTMSATHIIILGGRLIVGWEDALFRGTANIVLRGNHYTEDIAMNDGVNLGAKAIGVIGGLDLHGLERRLRNTHLASQLSKGSSTITVEKPPIDWTDGDEIVIASTSADPWETETFKIIYVNHTTITLNASAAHDHIAETFTYTDDGVEKSYDIRAEVSLLSRNIKVTGEDYPGLFDESFGARILIAGSGGARGYARIENVEFYHAGQEGWIDNYDPRYALAFLNTGQVDAVRPSYVRRNTFHNGFNTAVGVFGANGMQVKENTVYHTVGPGIRVEGANATISKNLVMLARTRSVYQDRFEDDLLRWEAAIEVNLAESPVLADNVVVGSERGGYRIDGHNCDLSSETISVEWGWNTARATLHGVFMNKDGFSICSLISKFKIHNAYDNGIYYQGSGSIKVSNVLVTDSTFAIASLVIEPPSVRHTYREKFVSIENSVVVAVSKSGYCPTLNEQTDYVRNSKNARGLRRTNADGLARTGILWPAFISGHNKAPSKSFVGSTTYPAIGGKTAVSNVTFVNFGDTSCSPNHTVFLTNLKVEDFLHPITTSSLRFVNSPKRSWLFFHRPSLGAINPSDCVDMECDGMKKALIVDEDGSMSETAGSSLLPQTEYEWDGDSKRGVGDYRVPNSMLTASDGTKKSVDDIAPNKGVLRANGGNTTCTVNDAWQGYECQGYHHGVLVVESLDADTETRRLSPVALVAEKYVDLYNGPQDHGWCAGYTCQERLSTFWMIVAFGKSYEMHFTSTAPEKLRLRILNEQVSTKMVLKIFYSRPQRLDVYVDNSRVLPQGNDGNVIDTPTTYEQYFPSVDSFIGSNYRDIDNKIMHVTLGGDSVIEIREAAVIILKFYLPAVSPDEFFDNGKLVRNLAAFLKIPESKIRFVRAVREGVALNRRRREVEAAYEATVEIGEPPTDSIVEASDSESTTAAPSSATTPNLSRISSTIVNSLQNGSLADEIGTGVRAVGLVRTRDYPVRNPNNTNSNDDSSEPSEVLYQVPGGLRVVNQPEEGDAETVLSPTLKVTGVGVNGDDIILGHWDDPWHATVTIYSGDDQALLSGSSIAKFENGYAEFENLEISRPGSYVLKIQVTYPKEHSNLTVITDPFTLSTITATSTIRTTSSNASDDIPTSVSNLTVIIVCGIVGGLLLIAIVTALVLKRPCSKTPSGGNKVSHLIQRPENSPPQYGETQRPATTKSTLRGMYEFEEPRHPHAVPDNPPAYETPRP